MKAIIMAGGEGSRLRPLTCGRPKPMVPVMNRPIMSHIVELLKNHGVTDIGVTLQYMPEAIRDYFGNGSECGVNMHYFVEETPLGTAGSVKNATSFLDETFLVISGDALTDLDLSRAVEFHRRQGALATLVLTRVDCPLEYGVVITAGDGEIKQFLEKPGWGEVFSDTVNTGIYVLEPEVLDYFAPGQKFDFSKDLFPLLLAGKKPLFGVALSGYWCDIGIVNIEIGPEFASQLGAAFGSVFDAGARVVVSSDTCPASKMIKEAISLGLQSAGAAVLDMGYGVTSLHRFCVRRFEAKAGVHVKVSSDAGDRVIAVFTNSKGSNIPRTLERKIENALAREDFTRVGPERIIPPQIAGGTADFYTSAITSGLTAVPASPAGFKALLAYDRPNLSLLVGELAAKMGFETVWFPSCGVNGRTSWQTFREMLPAIASAVVQSGADLGAVLDPNAERLILIDEKGQIIQDDLFTALLALIVLKGEGGPVVVPVTAPRAIENLAELYQGQVVRTKTARQDFLEKVLAQDGHDGESSRFFLYFDALAALAKVIDYTAGQRAALSTLLEEIPAFFTDRRTVPVPWEAKGRVIRSLIQNTPDEQLELLDGVKVYHRDGWALVLPDPDEPLCRVFSEGSTMEIAEELTAFYTNKISEITKARSKN